MADNFKRPEGPGFNPLGQAISKVWATSGLHQTMADQATTAALQLSQDGERAGPKTSPQTVKNSIFSDEHEVLKIITILFMSHRIQAKVYKHDTFTSFLDRLRLIMPNISADEPIGLYHLFFIMQEEDEDLGTMVVNKSQPALT